MELYWMCDLAPCGRELIQPDGRKITVKYIPVNERITYRDLLRA